MKQTITKQENLNSLEFYFRNGLKLNIHKIEKGKEEWQY